MKHGLPLHDIRNEIHVSDKVVVEHTSQTAGISEAIFNHLFPKEPTPARLYHYTDLDSLEGIASSSELRLYPINKRLDEGGELSAFAKAHNLSGYLNDDDGEALYKDMSKDLFYISLTRQIAKDPRLMWGYFASGTGVRLELTIDPKWADLRPMNYESGNDKTLLATINKALVAQGYPQLTPWGISRLGAFYLSSTVSLEDEVRLLVKRFEGGPDLTHYDGRFDYWPIPIGTPNNYCTIDVTAIHVAPNGKNEEVRKRIANTNLASVPVTGP
ncbi:hypothetical protein GCM10007927_22320 [Sulfitobacter pacificus]|uniref:DUF2971 domain-containing protein n=1 Tax=Sulfitobacter pacificus TaxID=1499314 RepID=A0ABQ5VK51_9RHOB|nr:hypothetical protein GCM10007927_22320 [Sulfitobacter pacificus]